MKPLGFYVKGQKLSKKPSIVFSTMIAGSNNFYDATFDFSDEWDKLTKVVKFGYGSVEEYIPLIQNTCRIPERIMKLPTFSCYFFIIYIHFFFFMDTTRVTKNI